MARRVATTAPSKRDSLKFRLTHTQVLRLSVDKVPAENEKGATVFVSRPKSEMGKAYRVLDGNQGAPTGFGFRVGPTRTTYEVVKRGPHGVRRFSLGNVADMGLEEAYKLAREKLEIVRETGDHPSRVEAAKRQREELKTITLAECFQAYIDQLQAKVAKKLAKPASVRAVQDSLARMERPEVGLAQRELRDIQPKDVEKGFVALRRSSMVRSNRIPTEMREALAKHKDWEGLKTEQLERMGITGKYIQRVRAAGLASSEHTFSDAYRAVEVVLKQERNQASRENRQPVVTYNPFQHVYDKEMFRSAQALRKHYERAEVRNPLGEDTLPKVLKAILARRDEQGGLNAAGADYLLLTLLWGTRRSEAAQLRWFDRCSKGELQQREVSWVWLAEPDQVNPYTKRAGSQAFLFDTKSGEERFLPVVYFAERVLQRRFEERLDDAAPKRELAAAEKLLREAKASGASREVVKHLEDAVEDAWKQMDRTRFVFPARSKRSKAGHYSDSKSIVSNVRRDAGLVDLREEVDIGLTPHDFRRTFGRFAAHLYGNSRVVSQMLHHSVREDGDMSAVSERYTVQEWSKLREAFASTEEYMVGLTPRVWNRLKGADKPRLDEAGDPPATIFAPRQQKTALESAPVDDDA